MPGGNSGFRGKTAVRVVVAGDRGTGKSTLIAAVATESFPDSVPPVLPPTRLPADYFPDRVPITIIDTSSSLESRVKRNAELKGADIVLLTYACDQPSTLSRLRTVWLEELRVLEVKAPVIVVGCKSDLADESHASNVEQVIGPTMQQYREIETCIECSAFTQLQVPDVFYYAQRAVLHPTAPLFDREAQALTPRCMRALRRIFLLCDHDMDGALNDAELNEFQVKCFGAPLQPAEIVAVRKVVQEKKKEGVNDLGLTLEGFVFLHSLFIEKGRLETTWAVLRKFGYNDDLKLTDDFLPVPSRLAPDQSIELTTEAVDFLRETFRSFDIRNRGWLLPGELEELFSTAPENPWCDYPYKNAEERTTVGNLTLNGFLSEWALMALLNPQDSLAHLIYIGYNGNPATAFRVTRRKSLDLKKQKTDRTVFQCLVFGPRNAGKSSLLNSFLKRPFSSTYDPTTCERYAANIVDQPGGSKKTLILREIPEDDVKNFLSNKESLAACDVAIFVYDSSDEYSWKRSSEQLQQLARHGEENNCRVPCLLVAAKDDLDPYPKIIQDSMRVCQELGIETPVPVSVKGDNTKSFFCRILSAAEHPHLSIPETNIGRKNKQFHQLVNQSVLFMSVGAAFAFVGLAAYRAYSARKSSSD